MEALRRRGTVRSMMNSGRRVKPMEGRIYTNEFRLYGMLHLPEFVGTARLLNLTDRPYLPVTSCMVYDAGFRHPPESDALQYETDFAAVPKDHILWVVGGRQEDASEHARREARLVYIMYTDYVLTGRLYIMPDQRVSDYLHTVFTDRPFQDLYGVRVLLPRRDVPLTDFEVLQHHDFVTVNLKQAGGVFDVRRGEGAAFRLEDSEI
jgi:hypothetical protein